MQSGAWEADAGEANSYAGSESQSLGQGAQGGDSVNYGAQSPRIPRSQISRAHPAVNFGFGERTSAVLSAQSADDCTALSAAEVAGEHTSQPPGTTAAVGQLPPFSVPPIALLKVMSKALADDVAQSPPGSVSPAYRANSLVSQANAAPPNKITAASKPPPGTSPRASSKNDLLNLPPQSRLQPRSRAALSSGIPSLPIRPKQRLPSQPSLSRSQSLVGAPSTLGVALGPSPTSAALAGAGQPQAGQDIKGLQPNTNNDARAKSAPLASPSPVIANTQAQEHLEPMKQQLKAQTSVVLDTVGQQPLSPTDPPLNGAVTNGVVLETGSGEVQPAALSACSLPSLVGTSIVEGHELALPLQQHPQQHSAILPAAMVMALRNHIIQSQAGSGTQGAMPQSIEVIGSLQALSAIQTKEHNSKEKLKSDEPVPQLAADTGAKQPMRQHDHPTASIAAAVITTSARSDGGTEMQQRVASKIDAGQIAGTNPSLPQVGNASAEGAPSSLAVMSTGAADAGGSVDMSAPRDQFEEEVADPMEEGQSGSRDEGAGSQMEQDAVIVSAPQQNAHVEGRGDIVVAQSVDGKFSKGKDEEMLQADSRGTSQAAVVAPAHSVLTTAAAAGETGEGMDDRSEALSPILAARAAAQAAAANAAPTTGTVLADGVHVGAGAVGIPAPASRRQQAMNPQGDQLPLPSTMAVSVGPGPEGYDNTLSGQLEQPPAAVLENGDHDDEEMTQQVEQNEIQSALPNGHKVENGYPTRAARSSIGNGGREASPERELTSPSRATQASSPSGKKMAKRKRN